MGPIFSVSSTTRSFGAQENHLIHVCTHSWACGKNLLSILDTPDFTDRENMNSTFREEPIKMATFHGNWDSSCNIDDPGWNPVRGRKPTESITVTYLGHPGVPKTKKESWEEASIERRPICNDQCRESTSLGKSWKSVNIDEHDRPPSPPRSLETRRWHSDVEI